MKIHCSKSTQRRASSTEAMKVLEESEEEESSKDDDEEEKDEIANLLGKFQKHRPEERRKKGFLLRRQEGKIKTK